ncbi:hypothetical protein BLNAU_17982 [Blattamonas nauphoetae]|uniref:Uncharacterized protein n=1 Tax=Blattamonas nauphoetae TaxID=2049346 RepID=A0ABQ9X5M1_9EUKA|nr:hypothetical protein BLNAU_17982 [Blattamonas nauphoetae]
MPVDKNSTTLQIDNAKAKHSNFLEVFLSQICGECKPLRPVMLNGLLILASESDWALPTIHDVEYIKPLEEYCEKTQPCDVPIEFPKLLYLIAKSSEGECLRICESSLPSILLDWMISISDDDMINEIGNCLLLLTSTHRSYSAFLTHNFTKFLAFIDHYENSESSFPRLTILAHLCFSQQLEVSMMALQALSTQSLSDSKTRDFLLKLKVPSASTARSSKLVPFIGQLCGRLPELVSEMKSHVSKSSGSNATISTRSAKHSAKSPHLNGYTVLEVLCEEFTLLATLLSETEDTFDDIMIKYDCVPLIKSTIIASVNLLEQQKSDSSCSPADRTDLLITILDSSWNFIASCFWRYHASLSRVVESTFSDVPLLCSLLERTCHHSSPTKLSHLRMIINLAINLPHLTPRMHAVNLVARMINASKPMAIPTTHTNFHLCLIWAISNLIWSPTNITQDEEGWKRFRMLQYDRVLKPVQQYLVFILQREEFIPTDGPSDKDLPSRIDHLLDQTLALEWDLFVSGENVEMGREEWEVGWLVEKTKQQVLGERLKRIRGDDVEMKMNEKARWKKRVERLREAGHEDAMEGWSIRRHRETRYEIVEYLARLSEESGMNNGRWNEWRHN